MTGTYLNPVHAANVVIGAARAFADKSLSLVGVPQRDELVGALAVFDAATEQRGLLGGEEEVAPEIAEELRLARLRIESNERGLSELTQANQELRQQLRTGRVIPPDHKVISDERDAAYRKLARKVDKLLRETFIPGNAQYAEMKAAYQELLATTPLNLPQEGS